MNNNIVNLNSNSDAVLSAGSTTNSKRKFLSQQNTTEVNKVRKRIVPTDKFASATTKTSEDEPSLKRAKTENKVWGFL